MIEVDSSEVEAVTKLFERRAQHMVGDALSRAERRAHQQQVRKRPHPGIKHARFIRHRVLSKVESASMIAHALEIELFRRVRNFFGDWQ